MRPGEAAADNSFDDEMVGGARGSHAHTEVKLPFGREVEVNGREELLLLVAQWIEAGERTVGAVIFQPATNDLGVATGKFKKIITDLEVGRELHSLAYAGAMEGAIKGGIKR